MIKMRKLKFIWSPVHKWTGLIVGVVLSVICFTGMILSFEKELTPLTMRSMYYHDTESGTPLKLEQLVEALEKQAPGRRVSSVVFPSDAKRNRIVTFADSPDENVYVNPYTGEVAGTFTYKGSFFSVVRELHRFLLIGKTGRLITGTVSLVFVFILLSGLFLHWPSSFSKIPAMFRFTWKGNNYRKIFTLHVVLGMYALVFLLLMALTGPFWSFEWYRDGIYKLAGVENAASTRGKGPSGKTQVKRLAPSDFSMIEDKVTVLETVQSDRKELRVMLPGAKENRFTIALIPVKQIHGRQSDQFTYDLQTGELQNESVFKTKSFRETFRMWMFAFHTGSWGGWFGKLLYCLAALIGATLPLTGYVLWWKKRNLKKRIKR